jgi:effector-binding domain-containing protein
MSIEERVFQEQDYIYAEGTAPMNDGAAIAQAMGSAFGQAFGFMQQAGITPLSPPISVYTEMPGAEMTFRCGFFVAPEDTGKISGGIQADKIPACSAFHTLHKGAYNSLNQSHGAIWAHAKSIGKASVMPVWEIYVNDPQETDEADLRTEIYHAIG